MTGSEHAADTTERATPVVDDVASTLLTLLAHPNIASKAATIHRYDHEIRGTTLVRPLAGVELDGPADGVVLAEPTASTGIAIGIGVNPWYGVHDPKAMAHAVVDEAIRNVVAAGADPARVALLDNFSWGNPLRASTLGELVAAVEGCCEAAQRYGAPFVSGKDSLNNEYVGDDGDRHAVPPTLVITAVAHVPDADSCVTSDLHSPGDALVLLGHTGAHFGGSHLDKIDHHHGPPGPVPGGDPSAPERYRRLHRAIRDGLVVACHDVSEGGLAVAVAEMCIGGRLGAEIDDLSALDPTTALFAESSGRHVVEVAPADVDAFLAAIGDDARVVGVVSSEPSDVASLTFAGHPPIPVERLVEAFTGGMP